ncbi:MAG: AlpA family transcriptional regulator [Pseudomonadota bacterium]
MNLSDSVEIISGWSPISQSAGPAGQGVQKNNNRVLRRSEVERITGLSRSTIYAWMQRGEFPQPLKLGTRLVAWREADVVAWLDSRDVRSCSHG